MVTIMITAGVTIMATMTVVTMIVTVVTVVTGTTGTMNIVAMIAIAMPTGTIGVGMRAGTGAVATCRWNTVRDTS